MAHPPHSKSLATRCSYCGRFRDSGFPEEFRIMTSFLAMSPIIRLKGACGIQVLIHRVDEGNIFSRGSRPG